METRGIYFVGSASCSFSVVWDVENHPGVNNFPECFLKSVSCEGDSLVFWGLRSGFRIFLNDSIKNSQPKERRVAFWGVVKCRMAKRYFSCIKRW